MSYTSKYTGQEIDSLLDKVGTLGAGQVTLLAESNEIINFPTGDGGQSINKDYILNDNIENYDIIAVEWGTTAADSLTPYFWLTEAIKKDNYETKYIALGGLSTSGRLTEVHFKFTSTETLNVVYARSMNYGTVIIKKIYGIKLNTANGSASANPIGAIVPIMGTTAPKDHLICDGSELNINEYKELADYFEAQFGSKDYFGGDGVNTFAIPDLRNEFLRGYGELSGEIGEHQDATTIPYNFNYYNAPAQDYTFTTNMKNGETNSVKDADALFVEEQTRLYRDMWVGKPGTSDNTSKTPYAFNPRPTNVAVLFCIKYTESGSTSGRNGYKETELLDTPVDYALKNSATILNAELELSDDITNYDELAIDCTVARSSDGGHTCTGQIRLLVSQISYNTSNDYTKVADGSTIPLNVTCHGGGANIFMATCSTYFKNFRTLAIGYTVSSNTNYNKFRIRSIKGIKH